MTNDPKTNNHKDHKDQQASSNTPDLSDFELDAVINEEQLRVEEKMRQAAEQEMEEQINQLRETVAELGKRSDTIFQTGFVHPYSKKEVALHDLIEAKQFNAQLFTTETLQMNNEDLETFRHHLSAASARLRERAGLALLDVEQFSAEIGNVTKKDPTRNLSNFRAAAQSLKKNFTALQNWAKAGDKLASSVDTMLSMRKQQHIRESIGLPPNQHAA